MMAKPRQHLSRAPIVEAVIDIRVLARDDINADVFAQVGAELPAYAERTPMHSVETRFDLRDGGLTPPESVQSDIGWLFRDDQRRTVVQFRVNGFTFNKLEPYSRWEDVLEEANRLWQVYIEFARPMQVRRLAVRYINRLELPLDADLHEYLAAPPAVPSPIPQTVREFLTRVVVYDSTRDASAIITQALESAIFPTLAPVLLDIDAFTEASLAPNDSSIPSIFEKLRDLKNTIFFASITEKTAEIYA